MFDNLSAGLIVTVVAVSLPLWFLAGWAIFDSWRGFAQSLYYLVRPDLWSFFRGDLEEDMEGEFRVFAWLIACAVMTAGVYFLAVKFVFTGE